MPSVAAGMVRVAIAEHAQRLARERVVALRDVGALMASVSGDRLALLHDVAAARQQDLRRALHHDPQIGGFLRVDVHGGMALAFGGERNFRYAPMPGERFPG